MTQTAGKISLQEFLALPQSDDRCELVEGELKPKMSPTTPHSRAQKRLVRFLDDWCEGTSAGEVNPEWTLTLERNGLDWAPVPDLAFISRQRIPTGWDGEGTCPGTPELAIEIISPGQTFGGMAEKAEDYLSAGVERVWVVDLQAQTVTVFRADTPLQTFKGEEWMVDAMLPDLKLQVAAIFNQRRKNS